MDSNKDCLDIEDCYHIRLIDARVIQVSSSTITVVKMIVESYSMTWEVHRTIDEIHSFINDISPTTTLPPITTELTQQLEILQSILQDVMNDSCSQKNVQHHDFISEGYKPALCTIQFLHEGQIYFKSSKSDYTLPLLPIYAILSSTYHLYLYRSNDDYALPLYDVELPIDSCVSSTEKPSVFVIENTKPNTSNETNSNDLEFLIFQTTNNIECEWWMKLLERLPAGKQKKIPAKVVDCLPKVPFTKTIFNQFNEELDPHQKKTLKKDVKQNLNIDLTNTIQLLQSKSSNSTLQDVLDYSVMSLTGVSRQKVENVIGTEMCITVNGEYLATSDLSSVKLNGKDKYELQTINPQLQLLIKAAVEHQNDIQIQKEDESTLVEQPLSCFAGEKIVKLYSNIVHLHLNYSVGLTTTCSSFKALPGTLIITSARIIFRNQHQSPLTSNYLFTTHEHNCSLQGFELPIASFYKLKKKRVVLPNQEKFCCVIINSKHFNKIHLAFFNGDNADELEKIISNSVGRSRMSELYTFKGHSNELAYRNELTRLGLNEAPVKLFTTSIQTYPKLLAIPLKSQDELQQAISFRSKGRLPAVTWANVQNQQYLFRSSQPLVGFKTQRCIADEKLLENAALLSKNKEIVIIDCRPKLNASANLFKGMGYEDTRNYWKAELVFLDIDNIHKMRESSVKLSNVVGKLLYTDLSPLDSVKMVAQTKWLYHITTILKGAYLTVDKLVNGNTVLVHCSDGWDRTSQIVSLVQLIVDPYYRTIKGFQSLIDKDWIAFGHKFQDRCRHLISTQSVNEYSPVFPQFLDCVAQFVKLSSSDFEFNETFLIEIAQQVYSCYFGNFLFNSYDVASQNYENLWDAMNQQDVINNYINPLFSPSTTVLPYTIFSENPPVFWGEYYLQNAQLHLG
ncbi:Myotubularin phosphatase domain-containing protein [Entamoeba marina]